MRRKGLTPSSHPDPSGTSTLNNHRPRRTGNSAEQLGQADRAFAVHGVRVLDADRAEAKLQVAYAPGPAYRFGTLQIQGGERYDLANGQTLCHGCHSSKTARESQRK